MKPETALGKQLQTFNRIAGVFHLAQALVLFLILDDAAKIPVITRFFDETPQGIQPVSETLFDFPISLIAPIFLLLSAFAHLMISAPFYIQRYEQNIAKGINPPRWWEYSISSSLMLVVLLMLGGLIEVSTVVFIFTLNFIMNLMGLVMERYNQLTDKVSWLPFNVGVVAGIVPWIMGAIYFIVSTGTLRKDELRAGNEYVFYRDGSCKSGGKRVCLNRSQSKQMCDWAVGLTVNVRKMATVMASPWEFMKFLQEGGDMANIRYGWDKSRDLCSVSWDIVGIYKGTSRRERYREYASTYIVTNAKDVLIHWTTTRW